MVHYNYRLSAAIQFPIFRQPPTTGGGGGRAKGEGEKSIQLASHCALRIQICVLPSLDIGQRAAGGGRWSVGVGDDCTNWAHVGFSCERFSLLLLLLSLAKRNMSRGLALGFAFAFWLCRCRCCCCCQSE